MLWLFNLQKGRLSEGNLGVLAGPVVQWLRYLVCTRRESFLYVFTKPKTEEIRVQFAAGP